MALACDIFAAIAQRLMDRAHDIAVFAETGFSFEEWCNWEACAACRAAGWSVNPKPRYCEMGVESCSDFGDLLVKDRQGNQVLIEVGLVHDQTGDKWLDKLERDRQKLLRIMSPDLRTLQIIVLVSAKEQIEEAVIWQSWLQRLHCWSRRTELLRHRPLGECGQIIIKGWIGETCGNRSE